MGLLKFMPRKISVHALCTFLRVRPETLLVGGEEAGTKSKPAKKPVAPAPKKARKKKAAKKLTRKGPPLEEKLRALGEFAPTVNDEAVVDVRTYEEQFAAASGGVVLGVQVSGDKLSEGGEE